MTFRAGTPIEEELAALQKEADSKTQELNRLKKLTEMFPDIRKHTGRWKKVAYYSKSVNTKVSGYDVRHNCGCCNDSPLEVWPYTETEFGKVYSDPPEFWVGEKHMMGYGDIPRAGWEEALNAANIPESIIERVRRHFATCKAQFIASIEEAYGEPDAPE